MRHIKPKMTLRDWLSNKYIAGDNILKAFDKECEEVTCLCKHQEYLENGDLFINIKTHQIFIKDDEIKIPLKQFKLLEYIMRNKGRCVPYSELLTSLWGSEHKNNLHYIRVFVGELRTALGDKNRVLIRTVPNVGLRMDVIKEA